MGGFFGIASKQDCVEDVFFGTDYHSHLGTYAGGLAACNSDTGLQRKLHNLANAPFRTRFENDLKDLSGNSALGVISDTSPQPLLIRTKFGTFAVSFVGVINNSEELLQRCLVQGNSHFDAMTGGKVNPVELLAALINNEDDLIKGIKSAQESIDGTASIVLLCEDGSLIAARDRLGRLPILIGEREGAHAVTFESFPLFKLGFNLVKELGPGEVVRLTPESIELVSPPGDTMRVCSFLWSYYGYPTTTYEGINVEAMRNRNGQIMAQRDLGNNVLEGIDYIAGVPDSGIPHAIGFANACGVPYARAFIKYTPTWTRSFMPSKQSDRNRIAKMKQIPVNEFIEGKNLLFVDDSIVRGTQLRETVQFLYKNGAKTVHIRSACPPIMYSCKYLNFTRATNEMELLTRRVINELEGEEGLKHLDEYSTPGTERNKKMRALICEKMDFASLEFQSLEGVVEAIGLEPCKLCTYCWNGKE